MKLELWFPVSVELGTVDISTYVVRVYQGVIVSTEKEFFTKESKLAKSLRCPCRAIKIGRWFFLHVYNGKFAVFWVLCYGITCKCVRQEFDMFVFHFGKIVTVFGFFRF